MANIVAGVSDMIELVNGEYVGVALCCLRHDYVEGCETSPVGYLEGVSIREGYRHMGIAGKPEFRRRKMIYENKN